jgi:hypothetical protein
VYIYIFSSIIDVEWLLARRKKKREAGKGTK